MKMTKALVSLPLALATCASMSGASLSPGPESSLAAAREAFGDLARFLPAVQPRPRLQVPMEAVAVPASATPKIGRIHVGAAVTLNGHDYDVAPGVVNIWMTVMGFFDVEDEQGLVIARQVPVEDKELFQVSADGSITGYAHLNVPFPIYKNGQYAGSGTVAGDIPMSGFVSSGHWAEIRGHGRLAGDAFIQR